MCKNYEQISHDFDCQIIGWKQLKIWSCHIALLVEIWNSACSSDFSPLAPNDQVGEEHQKLINQFQWSFVFHLFCGVFLHWRIGSCLPWLWKLTSSRDGDGVSGVENDVSRWTDPSEKMGWRIGSYQLHDLKASKLWRWRPCFFAEKTAMKMHWRVGSYLPKDNSGDEDGVSLKKGLW